MKQPQFVNIAGNKYRITYCSSKGDVDIDHQFSDLLGQIVYDRKEIRIFIGKGQTQKDILDTLLHEILEGIFNHHPTIQVAIKKNLEHQVLTEIASILADTLIRSKINLEKL